MQSRVWVLILVFVLNLVATVATDSSHIELEFHDSYQSHFANHKKIEKKNKEHCDEHEDCHVGHYHYYISFCPEPFSFEKTCDLLIFNKLQDSYVSLSIDVIKPPLV